MRRPSKRRRLGSGTGIVQVFKDNRIVADRLAAELKFKEQRAAEALSRQSERLNGEVGRFIAGVKAA